MIAKIIELSVRNKFMVLLLTAMLVVAGIWATIHISLDAVPDLSDVQVIVTTDYAGQAPNVVEDQVTYPLTTAMMGIPHAKVVRGISMFEQSFIYIIFDDGTDLYWARSRVLEYLNFVKGRLPAGVGERELPQVRQAELRMRAARSSGTRAAVPVDQVGGPAQDGRPPARRWPAVLG